VLEAFVLHEKIPLLIRELIACELWKQNALPLMRDWLNKNNSIKGYLLIYQEAVLANLLEALLFHKDGCDAAGDLVVELADYCHRKLVWLLNVTPPDRPKDKDALKKQLLKESEEDYLLAQERTVAMSCATCTLSIVRFLTDHLASLPLAVTARILDTYDILMLLGPLLELKPWQAQSADGEMRRFANGTWARVSDSEKSKTSKCEIQGWLAVYNLVCDPAVRRRYQFNSFRKNALLRLRGLLHETLVDQVPVLVELQRALDEMTLSEAPNAAEGKPAYVLEQLPELRDSLSKGISWRKVADEQLSDSLNDSEEEKRATAQMLAGVFDMDGMDELIEQVNGGGAMQEKKLTYFLEVTFLDSSGAEVAKIVAESEDDALQDQAPFIIPNEQKQTLIPMKCNEGGCVKVALNSGLGEPWTSQAELELADDKKKQWHQVGVNPDCIRVQLHFLRAPDGSGFHLIHTRVTPPPLCTLTLSFKDAKDGSEAVVRACGRGVLPQTPYKVKELDSFVRVPKLCCASAVLEVGNELDRFECSPTDLQLGGASQMQWRQVGKSHLELRVQIKLAPSAEGGYVITHLRATLPSGARGHAETSKESAKSSDVSPVVKCEAGSGSCASKGVIDTFADTPAAEAAAADAAAPDVAMEAEQAVPAPAVAPPAAARSTKVEADELFTQDNMEAAAEIYTKLINQSRENSPSLLSNRAACHLALGAFDACIADCDEALHSGAKLAPRVQIKLLLRRCEARRLSGKPGCIFQACEDLAAAKALPQNENTAAMIRTAEEKLDAGIRGEDAEPPKNPRLPPASKNLPNEDIENETNGLKQPVLHSTISNSEAGGRQLELLVELPGVTAFKELTLELSANRIELSGSGYFLNATLPITVDSEKTSARFSKKSQTLKIFAQEA